MINGNFKFFEPSKALFKDGASVVASSGTTSEDNIIDGDKTTRWESIGSDDVTAETITITFSEEKEISRLLLLNHNFSDYTITPVTSGTIQDYLDFDIEDGSSAAINDDGGIIPFKNVTSLLSSVETQSISETDYSLNSSYYEFMPILASGLVITITKAQERIDDVPDQEKYLYRVIPTSEVNTNNGTFAGYPLLLNARDSNINTRRSINGRGNIKKMQPALTASVSFQSGNQQDDADIVQHLRDRAESFLFWPNGGNLTVNETDDYHYRFNVAPYRLTDIFLTQVDDSTLSEFINNITITPFQTSFGLREVN